ncbi:Glutathione synthetase [Hypsibius exemplaris]|uniref:Glutathione synthetase n=1 Tax=Hypsibius exemplaris TaxID=2072580 RepID=A0A1W0WE22_HYPEX|nr:Glutathione synthetase [Hypsibius exemplaris]
MAGKVAQDEVQSLVERVGLNPGLLEESVEVLRDAAASLGVLLRHPVHKDTLKVAPLTLFPTVVPQEALNEIVFLQPTINHLMNKVAHDRSFLSLSLGGIAGVDPFIQNLFDIYRQIDFSTQCELGLIRSDYILAQNLSANGGSVSFQQVEVNMVCVGLAALGAKIAPAHKHALQFLGSNLLERSPSITGDTLSVYGEGLRAAYDLYCLEFVRDVGKRAPVMLVVIHDGFEFNIMDQRFVEMAAGVPSLRRTFRQIAETARVDARGCLYVEDREVAVVYYRTGYSPNQYKDRDWEMRLLMEQSKAIKSPSVAHQLAGFKKIQQVLCRTDVLARYIPDQSVISRLLNTFVGQWDLSEKNADEHIEAALREPERYVLKPNREGGGNNFYGHDLVRQIKQVRGTANAQEFILMELIRPVMQENVLIRAEMPPERVQTISEVGVFGVILTRNGGEEVLLNRTAGEVLIRSKADGVREGGVSSGHSCISSVVAV